jgi:transcriptional regulator with XRE-family HTH domain
MQWLRHLPTIRHAKRLSQAELGDRAGIRQEAVSAYERGMPVSDQSHIQKLADALGIDPAALSADQITIGTSPSGEVSVTAATREEVVARAKTAVAEARRRGGMM